MPKKPRSQTAAKHSPASNKNINAATKASPESDLAAPKRGRGRPRQGQAIARNLPRDEEILQIAAEVLYDKGFAGARLDDIATAAGIVKGSLYHYFNSKEEIYERLVNHVRGKIDFDMEVHGSEPADARLRHLIRTRLETTAEFPVEIGLLAKEMIRLDGPAGDWAREDPKKYFKAIRQIILQGQKEGSFRAVDPDVIASTIVGIFIQLPAWYRREGRIAPDALVEELTDFIMAGIVRT